MKTLRYVLLILLAVVSAAQAYTWSAEKEMLHAKDLLAQVDPEATFKEVPWTESQIDKISYYIRYTKDDKACSIVIQEYKHNVVKGQHPACHQ